MHWRRIYGLWLHAIRICMQQMMIQAITQFLCQRLILLINPLMHRKMISNHHCRISSSHIFTLQRIRPTSTLCKWRRWFRPWASVCSSPCSCLGLWRCSWILVLQIHPQWCTLDALLGSSSRWSRSRHCSRSGQTCPCSSPCSCLVQLKRRWFQRQKDLASIWGSTVACSKICQGNSCRQIWRHSKPRSQQWWCTQLRQRRTPRDILGQYSLDRLYQTCSSQHSTLCSSDIRYSSWYINRQFPHLVPCTATIKLISWPMFNTPDMSRHLCWKPIEPGSQPRWDLSRVLASRSTMGREEDLPPTRDTEMLQSSVI